MVFRFYMLAAYLKDVNRMQSDVFNKKAEWLEVEEKIKLAFCGNRETAVTTHHIIDFELSYNITHDINCIISL